MEPSAVIETEIEKLNNLDKFWQFIDLSTIFHLRRCRHNNFGNCNFIEAITNIYIENFYDKENGTQNVQRFCREYFRNFFSLVTLLKCLAIIEKDKIELEENIENVKWINNSAYIT